MLHRNSFGDEAACTKCISSLFP